jgi:hypothetical protein
VIVGIVEFMKVHILILLTITRDIDLNILLVQMCSKISVKIIKLPPVFNVKIFVRKRIAYGFKFQPNFSNSIQLRANG